MLAPARARPTRKIIAAAIDRALDAWPAIEAGEFERAMLLLHTKEKKP